MMIQGKSNTGLSCWKKAGFYLLAASVILMLSPHVAGETTSHFKLLSAVEFSGKEHQHRSQAETFFTVSRQSLGQNRYEYRISGDNIAPASEQGPSAQGEPIEISFTVDRDSGQLQSSSQNSHLLQLVNNRCVKELNKISEEQISQTWEQSFDLSFLGEWLNNELKLTMDATRLETEVYGEVIVVRALSEPFNVDVISPDETTKSLECRINSAYLFDSEIEEIYMSVSVFEAVHKIDLFTKETLRYEIATYRTDSDGVAIDLAGLDKKFGKFIRKVGLTRKGVKVKNEGPLPRWAQSEGLRAAQVTNLCAAVACEGAINPVASICIPAAHTVQMQSSGALLTAGQAGTVSTMLASSVPAIGSMKIAAAPAFMGMSMGTAGAVAGGTVGTVALAGGFSSDSSSKSLAAP